MNDERFELKLQAYLDGELMPRESEELAAALAKDAQARALLDELRNTRSSLARNEMEIALPETREFFWSKVEREIARQERASAAAALSPSSPSWLAWVRHHLVSVSGAALVAGFLGLMLVRSGAAPLAEMEMMSDEMGTYTYRDQQDKMTMVWFYDKGDDSDVAEHAAIASMDPEE